MTAGKEGRVILHVDMDAFYAAVEQHDHPEWRAKPLIVGADPRRGGGRGVVLTASYEAREYGVRSAMPIREALRLSPDAVFARPRMERYAEVSRAVRVVLRAFTGGPVEPVSIDEAFLDVTQAVRSGQFDDGREAGRALKRAVREATGLSCSVGVAPSKSAAKIAADLRKPDGLTVVPPDGVAAFLAPLSVRKISGVGPKTAAWLEELGILTIGDLASRGPAWAEARLGRHGAGLWRVASGFDDRPVAADRGLPKSHSEERTFGEDVADPGVLHRAVRRMAADVVDDLVARGLLYRVVGLKIRTRDFRTLTRATTLSAPTDRLAPALAALRAQLAEFADGRRRYRLVGARFAGLERDVGQATLEDFGAGDDARAGPRAPAPRDAPPARRARRHRRGALR